MVQIQYNSIFRNFHAYKICLFDEIQLLKIKGALSWSLGAPYMPKNFPKWLQNT